MARASHTVGMAIAGFGVAVVGAILALVAVVGIVLLVLWLSEPSPSANARTQVQALFVNDALKRTGTVKTCKKVGQGNAPGQAVWACQVAGSDCLRTYTFAVGGGYPAAPWSTRSFSATDNPCDTTGNH